MLSGDRQDPFGLGSFPLTREMSENPVSHDIIDISLGKLRNGIGHCEFVWVATNLSGSLLATIRQTT